MVACQADVWKRAEYSQVKTSCRSAMATAIGTHGASSAGTSPAAIVATNTVTTKTTTISSASSTVRRAVSTAAAAARLQNRASTRSVPAALIPAEAPSAADLSRAAVRSALETSVMGSTNSALLSRRVQGEHSSALPGPPAGGG